MSSDVESFSHRCLRVEDWPPLHRAAWEPAFKTGGLFDQLGSRRWRPQSAEKTQRLWRLD